MAALAPQGAPEFDIIVADSLGERLCGIQVKTRSGRGGDGGWHMKPRHETLDIGKLFFCFVDFGSDERARPSVHVVPCRIVATAIRESHAAWLSSPGRGGHVRKDSNVRRLLPDYAYGFGTRNNPYPEGWLHPYLNAWKLIAGSA